MRAFIILLAIIALIGLAWFLLTQAEILPQISDTMNIFDKEAIGEWFSKKLQEISELIGYETGAIYD